MDMTMIGMAILSLGGLGAAGVVLTVKVVRFWKDDYLGF